MLLDAQGIVKDFGGLRAVNGVSMRVEAGEIVGLIGPNGAGKTTFLNCVAGTYKPSAGAVRFMDSNTTGAPPEVMCRRGLARTFQIPLPFPKLTALENVMVGAVFGAGHPLGKQARKLAEEALAFVCFPQAFDTRADRLNAAQLKRLDLARALACRPTLLLLDELASGLTPAELDDMMALILKIRHQFGAGMIVIEHIMKVIVGICDRVLAIDYGTPLAEGTVAEVMRDPDVIRAYLGDAVAVELTAVRGPAVEEVA